MASIIVSIVVTKQLWYEALIVCRQTFVQYLVPWPIYPSRSRPLSLNRICTAASVFSQQLALLPAIKVYRL